MGEKATGRLGILEGMAMALAIAVASLAMAQAQPGLRGCATAVPARHDAVPAKPDADAADMLLHD
ncbi:MULTISPECIES: hypothetical protein [unclassified Mesorhizobium]|uniref:hypothetical protein n=1 Tax=unclassified Mesorhizobium TaxID=325217 RepID=UPI000BAED91C|nr:MULTISPECIES: hypothetical protein [unclassified Mesorhizobium]PBB23515.1 hypothetical protein CK232_26580 [Mesorhizobium sp. WSM4304]PBB72359.1 hypothetical protein CK227_26280 [Mesorhizobium sp. WSM4308]TRC75375.1 hypothetical protein FJV80_27785 [Mesorhizobium sp. WSM4310]